VPPGDGRGGPAGAPTALAVSPRQPVAPAAPRWQRPVAIGDHGGVTVPPTPESIDAGPPATPGAPSWAVHLPPGTVPEAVDLTGAGNLSRTWLTHWRADPGRPVLHDGERWVTAAELEARTTAAALGLRRAGLSPGDAVVLVAASSAALVVVHVAALRLGLVVVPANPAATVPELAHVVSSARPGAVLADGAAMATATAATSARASATGPTVGVVFLGDVDGADANPHTDIGVADEALLDAAAPDDQALLLYTSGTTGAPKGVPLTHANLLSSAEALRLAWRWTPEDRLVLALPLFHLHGVGVGLYGSLGAGAAIVLRPGFSVEDVTDAIDESGATLLFGVPTMYGRLAASTRLGALRRLRLCVSGSAPLAVAVHEAVTAGCGQRVLERYGMTETGMIASNPHDGERRPGTVGFPLPGVELRLHGDGDEILVRGPNVFAGYDGPTSASGDPAPPGGWFRTGDLGAVDADGYLRIVGRNKDLIISGGANVYPREVEEVLAGHPGVVEVAVVGIPDPDWGEQVVAFVEGSASAASITRYGQARLAPYKRPKEVWVVDALPRTALGKVRKDELRARAAGS
jgi:malonyl-CoA/methylmalonyl-CoA synthetase